MTVWTCIEDLRNAARRRVPREFFDYFESGSYSEETLAANRTGFSKIKLRQKVLADVAGRTLGVTIAGQPASFPVAIAPIGLMGMAWRDGEIAACRAAQNAGVPFTLSTMSICAIEDVAGAVDKPFWFQLYVMKDRGFTADLIERAKSAKCSALVLTVDLQMLGQRHRDVKNGLSIPPQVRLGTVLGIASRPAWAMSVLSGQRKTFGNLAGRVRGMEDVRSLAEWTATQFDPALTWDILDWVKARWPGKLIIKGVMDAEDAARAVAGGADVVVVSNHGGRQLDGAPSSISALPPVVDAVGDRAEILMDGGVRSGQDVLRALALGARGCLLGRAPLYGLGAAGEAGVSAALEIIRKELDFSMAMTGVKRVADVDARILAG